jgi:hypothetical protein
VKEPLPAQHSDVTDVQVSATFAFTGKPLFQRNALGT